MTGFPRAINNSERRQIVQYWQWLQDLISENYGAGRLLRTRDDLYWIQRVLDEQLLWDERDAHRGIAAAIGETVVQERESVEWTVDELDGYGLSCRNSGGSWRLFAEVLERLDANEAFDVGTFCEQALEQLDLTG